ncbi:Mbeg1-like protein [Streptococcus loxodontisalivarius]|uniref:DUF2974 domain-containing protein n=1 Tax=Streptococcus loxodontisalivarius TaxID=1349415 RepID=A0ABS2PW51_9STRE|nr:Mbeg1-like protein [Streptococcus loxodontisalivarius]MBM7643770.1 hypothetical protein [Streptococcus loxodontisalivarius]
MAGIIDYVKAVSERDFEEFPLNELDIVCLNEIGYVSFGEVLSSIFDLGKKLRLSEVLDHYSKEENQKLYQVTNPFMMTAERLELLKEMLSSKRFQSLSLSYYVNDINREYEKQFAAMVFTIESIGHEQIVIRGTDDSLIGWKEDFKLTYSREIAAHRSAIAYLKMVLPDLGQNVYLSGHSKGGNIALYAASQLKAELQSQLLVIYMLDAPGLQEEMLSSRGYRAVRDKIVFLRPQESIVGVMLSLDVPVKIVKSASFGISQHAVTNWQVNLDGSFMTQEQGTELSQNLEKTFKNWTRELGSQDLKLLFDTLFDTLIDNGIQSLNDINLESLNKVRKALTAFSSLPQRKRSLMTKAGLTFLAIFTSSLRPNRLLAQKQEKNESEK